MGGAETRRVRYLARPAADAIADRAADWDPGRTANRAASLNADRDPDTDDDYDAIGHHGADRHSCVAGAAHSPVSTRHTDADSGKRRANRSAAHANGNAKAVMRVTSDE